MIDFTNAVEVFNNYSGSEKKKTLLYNGKKYLVKFPDPVREKNKNISYINNSFSEYIGSNVFKLFNINVQETLLGIYNYNGKEKIVCACEDFTNDSNVLYEFDNLALSTNLDKKIETEISDIMEVINESSNLINVVETKTMFWNMFAIDALIGNTNRYNGDWGFIYDKINDRYSFSPIYDCGSCLNPMLSDEEMEGIDETTLKNLALNAYSCLKENNKKINYFEYLKSSNNKDCINSFKTLYSNFDINLVNDFIDKIEYIKDVRKNFYKKIINYRYNLIIDILTQVS